MNDPRIDDMATHWFDSDQLQLFAAPGYRFFRDLETGDRFTLGTRDKHGAFFTVTNNNPAAGWVMVHYVNRNGIPIDHRWDYKTNSMCLVEADL